jgi:hypothetical protein
MDRQEALNFSTDLLRISNWIMAGQDKIADEFIGWCKKQYEIPEKYTNIFGLVEKWREDRYKAADAASTMSRLIL